MSKLKHKMKKADGGGVDTKDPEPEIDGGNPDVMKEAKAKTVGAISGEPAMRRRDRGGRTGRAGADKSPLSASSSKAPFTSAGKC